MSELLLGKPIAEKLRAEQAERIQRGGVQPHLVIIQAGDNLASTTYIKMKIKYGESIGARVTHDVRSGELADLQEGVRAANEDEGVQGIIVQLPLPDTSITDDVIGLIDPAKDVDGLTERGQFPAATAEAAMAILDGYNVELSGIPVAMVGYGRLVGRPLTEMLRERGADVTVCDINTQDLGAETRRSKVVVSATGSGGLIKPGMISPGTVVVDVGTAEDAGALVGDVDPAVLDMDDVRVTPSKGGVGPVTVCMLFEHVLGAAGL